MVTVDPRVDPFAILKDAMMIGMKGLEQGPIHLEFYPFHCVSILN
jgi:hypothetical protein